MNGNFLDPLGGVIRKLVFRIHLCLGLGLGLYLSLMGVTGAILVFANEIALAKNPQFYRVQGIAAPTLGIAEVSDAIRGQYPAHRIYRMFAPTTKRQTYIVILEKDDVFPMLFVHPVTGTVIGENARDAMFGRVWRVHANLAGGQTGRVVNCVLGLFVLLLPVTGLLLWWPGAKPWWRKLIASPNPAWTSTRGLHAVVGLWAAAFIALFAATGSYYYFGQHFFRVLRVVSPLVEPPNPRSTPPVPGARPAAALQAMVDEARKSAPGKHVWGVDPAWSGTSPIKIIMGSIGDDLGPEDWYWSNTGHHYVYFDQYSGEVIARWDVKQRTFADSVRAWAAPLHKGSFGGVGVKTVWAIAGLAPVVLFVLGCCMWWQRRYRP